jgi:SNF2 family DNA or RNA helicase
VTRPSVKVGPDDAGRGVVLTGDDVASLLAAVGIRGRCRGSSVLIGFAEAVDLLDEDVEWDVLARVAVQNRHRVSERAPEMLERARALVEGGPIPARRLVAGRPWAAKLDDHQVVNVAAMTVPGGWGGCIFDEQGTGKTPTTVAIFDTLAEEDEVDIMVVVAPKSMVAEWPLEVAKFTDDLYNTVVVEGDRAKKAAAINSGADVLVVNYEGVVGALPNFVLLARRARIMLAVDESFFVKNPDSERTAAVRTLREYCTRAYVLCGTPAPNSPADVVAQFNLVDFGLTFDGVNLDKDRDVASVQARGAMEARGLYVRSLKRVVLPDLPERVFNEVTVHMAPLQRAAYDAALDQLILDLRDTSESEYARSILTFLERRATLLRICSDPSPVIPGYDETPGKFDALDKVLAEYIVNQGEKVVLWSFFRASVERAVTRYAGYGLVRIDGSVTSTRDRREAIRRFQEDDSTMLFVGNPAAAGAGLTLHRARVAVYESLSNQAAHFLQSLDRIHRRGQSRPVEYLTLLAEESIELAEYRRLLDKAGRQADLLGDPPDSRLTRELLLEELLASRDARTP